MEISTGRLRDSRAFPGLEHSVTATHRYKPLQGTGYQPGLQTDTSTEHLVWLAKSKLKL